MSIVATGPQCRLDRTLVAGLDPQCRCGPPLVPSQPSTDGSNRATPPDSTHQFRLGPPLEIDRSLEFGVGLDDCPNLGFPPVKRRRRCY
ncbi:hypothetical protein CYV19_03455 [Natronobacterium gregoryi SP2]|uniref:Uncharacterized protein n=1 Tax=Natronobacterium gregoryi (strain ATCC 43098 / DSM 3393 / CCM 3738 / CIP 104747 / IAM 13177 / JCM 8860 / NBRC 102187 / NCIMB 2189 / SP2) TaxID=797304 RepID=A0A2J4JIB6_NATGS|nr:hypothetical protein CYV19_03455 [Natronobacterium gregoryi SP2]